MSHPCPFCNCPDNIRGECFGGGCKRNPAPKEREDYYDEDFDSSGGDAAETGGRAGCATGDAKPCIGMGYV